MDTALDSDFDLNSMYPYSPASKSSSALSYQSSRPSRHDQYEISGLTRIPALALLVCSLFFFLGSHLLKAAPTLAPLQEEDHIPSIEEHFFTPLDSDPDVKSFSKITSLFSIGKETIKKILPAWNRWRKDDFQRENNFEKRPDSPMAISTFSLTWNDVGDLLNYTAWQLGEASPLYTEEVKEHITCRKDPSSSWFWSSPATYTFQVKPESEDQIASLDFLTACRCLNVREVHYWLYYSLRKVEQALRAGQIIDQRWWNDKVIWKKKDPMVSYCREHQLWPLFDAGLNRIQKLLEQSTEIGAYFFSLDGKSIAQANTSSVYRFPLKEKLALFFGSDPDSTWCIDDEGDESGEVRLALDTTLMKQETDFENAFPSERLRKDFKEFPSATNQDQEALLNQDRLFKDDLKEVAVVLTIVGGVPLGYTIPDVLINIYQWILGNPHSWSYN